MSCRLLLELFTPKGELVKVVLDEQLNSDETAKAMYSMRCAQHEKDGNVVLARLYNTSSPHPVRYLTHKKDAVFRTYLSALCDGQMRALHSRPGPGYVPPIGAHEHS